MSEIKAIVFDMDGVLLDSETICDRTWEMAAVEYGIKDPSVIMRRCLGTNKNDAMQIIKEELGQDFPAGEYLERTSELFRQIEFSSGIPLMPYVKEALEYLKTKYRLCVASSTRKVHVMRQLGNAGLVPYFETFTCGDMVEHSKPHPEIYLMACKSLGTDPSNCAAVEDSPNGIKSAYAAGLKTIMVPDKVQPDSTLLPMVNHLCKSLADIMQIL